MKLEKGEKLVFISELIASPIFFFFTASRKAELLLIYLAVVESFCAILMACKT